MLNPAIRRQIDAVLAGRSTALTLDRLRRDDLPELLPEIRKIGGLLQFLSLEGARFEGFPSLLEELPNLTAIDLKNAEITDLPRSLPNVRLSVNARQLISLGDRVNPNNIFAIRISWKETPQAIEHMFDLGQSRALSISEFYFSADASPNADGRQQMHSRSFFRLIDSRLDDFLETQPGIRKLALFGLPIGRIPDPIHRMQALTEAWLTGIQLFEIPDWLFEAPQLTSLNLSFNNLPVLPDTISAARQLKSLRLRENQIWRIPAELWELRTLEILDLLGCPIREIPPDLLRLNRLSSLLFDVDKLVIPPPEIAAQGLDAIKRYWIQERDSGVDYLAEAKLLIVGESGAGKTSLAKKILDPGYELDKTEDSTSGIDVLGWQFPTSIRVRDQAGERLLQRDFRVNIWDFGGQEIYHSTHQFFLTKRSVYVLVTDERREDTDFEYWLEIVNLLSEGSPLIIVQNRKQGRIHGVDFGALRRRYPNLRGTLALDLADNSGLDQAVEEIRKELEHLPHIGTPLPKTWRAVRLALEADPRNYISAADFFGICQANGFTDRENMRQLGGYLHDLGICLFFQDDALLSKTVILKPEWGTAAVYRVLDDLEIAGALGVFTKSDLDRIWSDVSYADMRDELLQLMVKFQLCFQVPGSDTHIAPQLLTPSRPIYDWDEGDNLVLRYEYDVMPKGIVRRLIVALHYQIADGDMLWRSGAVFEYEGSRAEVIEVYRRRLLTIRIRGRDPRVLLGLIDHELGIIHRSYQGIRFKKCMPCGCETCSVSSEPTMFEVDRLKEFAQAGDAIQCQRSRQLRDPVELLRMLAPDPLGYGPGTPAAQRPRAAPRVISVQPEVFVSYKWRGESESLVDEIELRMTERGVRITRDKNELVYRNPIQQFMRRIGAGKYIIVILGNEYLQSRNCMYELTQIASYPEFASRVYPIVLSDAGIYDAMTRLGHIKYWEDKRNELDAKMKGVNQERLEGIREEIDLYAEIRNTIGRLMGVLSDMNTLTPEIHRGTDFEQLYAQLTTALQADGWTAGS